MKNNKFSIREKKDAILIQMVAEILNKKKEKLVGKIISWEFITEEFGFTVPLPEEEMEMSQWVHVRSAWIGYINDEFIRNKYPCKLFVMRNKGVILTTNGVVPGKTATKEYKKIFNTHKTGINRMNILKESHPTLVKFIERWVSNIEDGSIYMLGQLTRDRTLPINVRREMKKIIQESLPLSDEG